MNDAVLLLKDVHRSYRMGKNILHVLKGVNFTVTSGEWCCVYGASGSGKTTLLNLIGGLERPDGRGEIYVCGENLAELSRKSAAAFRAEKIGFIFQSYHLLPELTILENAAIAGTIAGKSFRKSKDRAAELLTEVGLSERMLHRPAELSGGEQQRAAIARSLMNDPMLLLADEPTGNLDPDTGSEILALFQKLRKDKPDMAIVMITHNYDIAGLASRVTELHNGIICEKMI